MSSCQDQINRVKISNHRFPTDIDTFADGLWICPLYIKLVKACKSPKKRFHISSKHPLLCGRIDKAELVNASGCFDVLSSTGYDRYWNDDGFRRVNKLLAANIEEDLFNYARENVILLNIMIKDLTVTRVMKEEYSTNVSFIANTGGLIGLCVGMSCVSLFEIIYHFIKFVSGKFDKRIVIET